MVVSKLLEKDVLFDQEHLFVHQLCSCGHPETPVQLIFLRTIKNRESERQRKKCSLLGEDARCSKKVNFPKVRKIL